MSERLVQIFMADGATKVDAPEEGKVALVWKAVLRTGTWKLRPGPGGVKLHSPLRIYRDKAPKGHISMTALKSNFDAGAVENVHVPIAQADAHAGRDVMDNAGFVRKLVIQDVMAEDGKTIKESWLWAGMEITEPDVAGKIERKTIPSVSGGILFDYERTEDGIKFDQVLDHCCLTPKPWINGTGGFRDKLPEGVMASEPADLDVTELEFDSSELAEYTGGGNLPAPGTVVWKPEEGYSYTRGRVQRALDDFRRQTLSSLRGPTGCLPLDVDVPYWSVDDVSDVSNGSGKALICSGYGAEKASWVANFKDDGDAMAVDPFTSWIEAKPEWVAASEELNGALGLSMSTIDQAREAVKLSTGLPGAQAVRDRAHELFPELKSRPAHAAPPLPPFEPTTLAGASLSQAREARAAARRSSPPATGGSVPALEDLLKGVDLSSLPEETRAAIRLEDEQRERDKARLAVLDTNDRDRSVVDYCGSTDGKTKGKLDALGLDTPGIKAFVRGVLLADDGGPAIELSETTGGGATVKVERTASDILKGFIDVLPKAEDGKVTLSSQAKNLPGDQRPGDDPTKDDKDDKRSSKEKSDAFLGEFGSELGVKVEA